MSRILYTFLLVLSLMMPGWSHAQQSMVHTFHYTTHDGLASNALNTAIIDRQGYLWIGTNLGLSRFDGYRFVNFYREANGKRRMENVTGIVEDTLRNRLLVCGSNYQVYPFDLGKMQFGVSDSTLQTLFAQILDPWRDEAATTHHAIERGVQCKNNTHRHNAFRYVELEGGHEVWTTIDNGFYMYDAISHNTTHFTSSDANPIIDSNFFSDVLLDRTKTVWMTNSLTGLYHLMPVERMVRRHHLATKVLSDLTGSVRSFSELPDGRLLVTNMDGDIYHCNLDKQSCEFYMHMDSRVYATLTDRQNRLWIATRNNGVWVGNRHLNETDGLDAYFISNLFLSDDNTVWLSTFDKGLISVKEGKNGHFDFAAYLPDEKVHQVKKDNHGHLWTATESGVFVSEGKAFRRVYEGCKVSGICCADDGAVYAATVGNGLLKICRKKGNDFAISFVTTASGLINDCVRAVVWSERFGVVVATEAGISVIAPDGMIRNMNSPEGMLADSYNESAALCINDGRVLLGSANGFVELQTEDEQIHVPTLGKPVITCMMVNDESYYQQYYNTVNLEYVQNDIAINFSCLDYKNLPSIIYSYRLDGVDDGWRPSTKETSALYCNLPPGTYHFRVRAAIAGQDWGEENMCEICIHQPWWWTWWARAAYLMIIFAVLWHEWNQYKQRMLLRRQLDQRLSALYAVETKLEQLNDNSVEADKASESVETENNLIERDASQDSAESDVSDVVNWQTDTDVSRKQNEDSTINQHDKEFLDRLDHVILSNLLQDPLDMAFLSSRMCISHSTLYRRIKVLTGMTANEYVRKHRLAKALQLLRGGHNATEVSMLCGFSSPSYFTRCFKAEYGILPSETT